MVLERPDRTLRWRDLPVPVPGPGEVLIQVHACAICRTDLHVLDGELPPHRDPVVLGHQVIGTVVSAGEGASLRIGTRVGVPWLGGSCGTCAWCRAGRENLCPEARYTGYDRDGGFAEYCAADARFCFPIPTEYEDLQAAPLLCAGLIGYRALRFTEGGSPLGLYGFGSSAHTVIQVARHQGRRVFAFTRPNDSRGQAFARTLGATWAGAADTSPPEPLQAAIIFAPSGELVPAALAAVDRGGIVVCAGIHMSDIPAFPYARLWQERVLRSVANLTRADGREFLALAPLVPVRTTVRAYPLHQANEALADLRAGRFVGAAVLSVAADAVRAATAVP